MDQAVAFIVSSPRNSVAGPNMHNHGRTRKTVSTDIDSAIAARRGPRRAARMKAARARFAGVSLLLIEDVS